MFVVLYNGQHKCSFIYSNQMKIIHTSDKETGLKLLDLITEINFPQKTYSPRQIEAAKLELKDIPLYGISNVVRRAELLTIINNPQKEIQEKELSRDEIGEQEYLYRLFTFRML